MKVSFNPSAWKITALLISFVLAALASSCFFPAQWNEFICRDARMRTPKFANNVFIDKQYSTAGHCFIVYTHAPQVKGWKTIDVPTDAIEYGLVEFAGITRNHQFFRRITAAAKKGLALKGYAQINCIHNDIPMMIQFVHREEMRHIEILANRMGDVKPKVYAIDISKISSNP